MKPSSAPFRGVILGLSSTPLGQITLPVTFGTWENFRTDIYFEVADFELAKFMVVPHYTYLMMKMLGPRGVISLHNDVKQALIYDKESCEMVQSHERSLGQ